MDGDLILGKSYTAEELNHYLSNNPDVGLVSNDDYSTFFIGWEIMHRKKEFVITEIKHDSNFMIYCDSKDGKIKELSLIPKIYFIKAK